MNYVKKFISKDTNTNIILLTIILSIIISYFSMHNTLVNNDGILYIKTSEVFLTEGFKQALQTYHWPVYSILVAALSKIMHLDVLSSYYLINTFLQAIIIFLYLKIFLLLAPTRRQLAIAAITIIIFPQFNEYRQDIIRDFGYWLFCLLGLINLIIFYTQDKNKSVIYYHLSFFLAFLFRAEALILCSILPLSIFCLNFDKNIKKTIIKEKLFALYFPLLLLIFACIAILLLTVLFFSQHMSWKELAFSLYFNLHIYQIDTLVHVYMNSITNLNQYIFTQTPINSFTGIFFLIFGATAVYIIKCITVLNIINFSLLIYFLYLLFNKKWFTNFKVNNAIRILLCAAVITSLLPLLFLCLIFITSGRYYVLSSIILLLFVPFSADYLWQKISDSSSYHKYKYCLNSITCILIITFCMSGIISFGYSKDYIKQAGTWFKDQNYDTNVSYTNNSQLNFYAGVNNTLIDNIDNCSNIRYLLIKLKHNDKTLSNKINQLTENKEVQLLHSFANKRGDRVVILECQNKQKI